MPTATLKLLSFRLSRIILMQRPQANMFPPYRSIITLHYRRSGKCATYGDLLPVQANGRTNPARFRTVLYFNSGLISRECFRTLLFSMLPDDDERPVLPLLPAVDCRYKTKPFPLINPIATEISPLSLSQNSALLPPISTQPSSQIYQNLFNPSPPICTMPPLPQRAIAVSTPLQPELSLVAVVPIKTPQCVRLKTSANVGLHSTTEIPLLTNDIISCDASTYHKTLLQLLPPSEKGKDRIPNLNETPIYVLGCSKSDKVQVYVRRSPRIQKAYDGERVSTVDRASRRIAAATPVSSGGSTSSSGNRRRGRPKGRKIGSVAPLPITVKPKLTPKSKIKELAKLCDVNTADIFKEASLLDKCTSPVVDT